jgi:predicted ribosome quality control (RQC) complex YloA/Tae2 family protein
MSSETYLNRAEAAKAIGKSEPTLDGYLKAGKFPKAKKVTEGKRQVWRIPLTDLLNSGLMDKVKPEAETASASPDQERLAELRENVAALRAENEQLRERLADLQQARADLIAAYAPQIETAQKQAERRRKWFTRG